VIALREPCDITGVLVQLQDDLWCSRCKAFSNSMRDVKESMDAFERDYLSELLHEPETLLSLFRDSINNFTAKVIDLI
jgi:hypothetical protein